MKTKTSKAKRAMNSNGGKPLRAAAGSARLSWVNDQASGYTLSRSKIRHGRTYTTEWEVYFGGRTIGIGGTKREARGIAETRYAQNDQALPRGGAQETKQ